MWWARHWCVCVSEGESARSVLARQQHTTLNARAEIKQTHLGDCCGDGLGDCTGDGLCDDVLLWRARRCEREQQRGTRHAHRTPQHTRVCAQKNKHTPGRLHRRRAGRLARRKAVWGSLLWWARHWCVCVSEGESARSVLARQQHTTLNARAEIKQTHLGDCCGDGLGDCTGDGLCDDVLLWRARRCEREQQRGTRHAHRTPQHTRVCAQKNKHTPGRLHRRRAGRLARRGARRALRRGAGAEAGAGAGAGAGARALARRRTGGLARRRAVFV